MVRTLKKKQQIPVQLIVIDEFSQISADISQRFFNEEKYAIQNFTSLRNFIENTKAYKTPAIRKVTVRILLLVMNRHQGNEDQVTEALDILQQLKQLPDKYSVVFLVDSKHKEQGQEVLEKGAGAWIVNNPNAIHWIDNHIKATLSRNNLEHHRKTSRTTVRILIIYLFLVALLTLLARVVFPWYF